MIRLGKTYGNLMVDVAAANEKLAGRVRRIVATASGASQQQVDDALEAADGDARVAIVSLLAGVDADHGPSPSRPLGPEHRRRAGARRMRLGVEAALVDGQLVPGDVEVLGGRVAGFGLVIAERSRASPCRASSTSRSTASQASTSSRPTPTGIATRATPSSRPASPPSCRRSSPPPKSSSSPPSARCLPSRTEPASWARTSKGRSCRPWRLGIHPAAARRNPDLELLERLLDAGPVRLVTLAPELPGAGAVIERLLRREIAVSCGHSDASAEQANAAFDLGVRSVTHLFNAMRPFHHRDPGIVGAALARPDVVVQVILDWVHIAPVTAAMVWQAAPARIALVTDAVAGAGVADGAYRLGELDVEIRDGVARGADGALAGSTLTMIEAVRNLHSLGVPARGCGRRCDRGARPRAAPAERSDGSGSACLPTSSC